MEYRDYWEDLDLQEFDVEEFLRGEQQSEQDRLEQELQRIEDLLSEREEIHSESVEELESKLDWYIEQLEDLYRGFGGGQKEEKENLKTKIEDFYSDLRREKRNQWRDKIELEMELREVEHALGEIEESDLFKLLQ
ncbi:hypothetical protein BRC72_11635 [Halobacteriales archaeon QH_7_66_36]|nr:MAG: hypothetical protein BRC72_11635 [Halobacteriales archaeon QH_7_66_36]